MRSVTSIAAVAALALSHAVVAQQPTDHPAADIKGLKTPTYVGCFSSVGSLVDQGEYTFQAMGWCQPLCVRQAKSILAFTGGNHCLCGSDEPQSGDKIDDSNCNLQCQGYPQQKCGGDGAYAVYQDGYKPGDSTGTIKIAAPSPTSLPDSQTPSDDSGDPASKTRPSTVFITQSGTTIPTVINFTQTAAPSTNSGPNKAAVAAGVVVGVVGFAAIIGGVILYMRRKRQLALAEERRRMEEHTRLAAGSDKPPSTFSLSDSRLEPSVMFQRRQSDGSIMDNQDYSRRILKVTNPDG